MRLLCQILASISFLISCLWYCAKCQTDGPIGPWLHAGFFMAQSLYWQIGANGQRKNSNNET